MAIAATVANPTASSHLAGRTERPNPKLSRGEDKSSLKYIISVLLSNSEYFIEKSLTSRLEFGFPFSMHPNSSQEAKLLVPKSAKKYCHVDTLKAFHLWSLATSVKAQRSTSRLSTNHIVGFLHLSN